MEKENGRLVFRRLMFRWLVFSTGVDIGRLDFPFALDCNRTAPRVGSTNRPRKRARSVPKREGPESGELDAKSRFAD